ncbi:MAG: hypothetical protein HKN73_13625 [Gemmatimonadetes bacterium]|nr:hypothetical protein [Gemmatimonadota bacterium]
MGTARVANAALELGDEFSPLPGREGVHRRGAGINGLVRDGVFNIQVANNHDRSSTAIAVSVVLLRLRGI